MEPRPATVTQPAGPVWCPSDAETFDARKLLDLSLRKAEAVAAEAGCSVRVVKRDGEDLARTEDFQPRRINVATQDGRVVAVEGVG